MGVEYEWKFRASPDVLTALEAAYPGQWQTLTMQTTYYDTPTGALSERRYTLRRRLENGRPVCTLKTPGTNGGRGEWEVLCDSVAEAIDELCKLSGLEELPLLSKEGLLPICGASFTRRAQCLPWQEGTVELALDRGVLTGGGREIPLREVEVELKSGSPCVAEAFAEEIARRYGLEPEHRSKFQRAMALGKGE